MLSVTLLARARPKLVVINIYFFFFLSVFYLFDGFYDSVCHRPGIRPSPAGGENDDDDDARDLVACVRPRLCVVK